MKLNEILNQHEFPTDQDEIKHILKEFEIKKCTIHPNGVVDVDGDVDLRYNKLTQLPVQFGKVRGNFNCSNNLLTSLKGCPTSVDFNFSCTRNNLTSLDGCPTYVGTCFDCGDNNITSLIGIADLLQSTKQFLHFKIYEITSGGLGLVLIENLKYINVNFKDDRVEQIIQKYIGRPDDIFDCQNELIEAGFEEYAKL